MSNDQPDITEGKLLIRPAKTAEMLDTTVAQLAKGRSGVEGNPYTDLPYLKLGKWIWYEPKTILAWLASRPRHRSTTEYPVDVATAKSLVIRARKYKARLAQRAAKKRRSSTAIEQTAVTMGAKPPGDE
jgi:hypothetical protein